MAVTLGRNLNSSKWRSVGRVVNVRGNLLALGEEEGDCCTRQKVRMRFKSSEEDCLTSGQCTIIDSYASRSWLCMDCRSNDAFLISTLPLFVGHLGFSGLRLLFCEDIVKSTGRASNI